MASRASIVFLLMMDIVLHDALGAVLRPCEREKAVS
jgi:hypothetical protein